MGILSRRTALEKPGSVQTLWHVGSGIPALTTTTTPLGANGRNAIPSCVIRFLKWRGMRITAALLICADSAVIHYGSTAQSHLRIWPSRQFCSSQNGEYIQDSLIFGTLNWPIISLSFLAYMMWCSLKQTIGG